MKLAILETGRPPGDLFSFRRSLQERGRSGQGVDVTALRDASFDVAKAEFVFLVGPSGSGKSTLLRLMNRQERPERGAVWVAGRHVAGTR